jgi:hypothetical protein
MHGAVIKIKISLKPVRHRKVYKCHLQRSNVHCTELCWLCIVIHITYLELCPCYHAKNLNSYGNVICPYTEEENGQGVAYVIQSITNI